ncbi:Acyl-coenzyme A:6-aminopenicillanic acid acyl-transferase [Symmachiella macrocystis]|uniref:Acyl-coenzyme A:6-aminopenicillanic acid acyl-transferase n=1 Tax=Symmachiella macrocystis TaxID=2527985 RepID=A0A5C6BL35_9PLAN|nr:C45 family peptidase [Symmachiella macrocystis]TWU12221.1 Acyl-coenzyme A:6-aminopenicillanic acid acyl-transferase [Symmachiella macrocystis]
MFSEITVQIADLPRKRWRLSRQQNQWAKELIRLSVDEVGGIAEYRDSILTHALKRINPEFTAEIEGLATQLDVDFAETLAANLYYDFVKRLLGCTAFAVNTENGPIHARNMDWFSHSNCLSEFTTIVNFMNNDDTTRFRSVSWPGSVGVLSGIAPGRFAVTLNAVLSDEPMQEATSVAFLIRKVCQESETFQDAVDALSTQVISSDCILLVTGTRKGEMVVIERTPTRHAIRTTEEDFIVATNDYRALDCEGVEQDGEIYKTTCGRFDAATMRLHSKLPINSEQCFAVLNDEHVKMQITVQQMVMSAATGMLNVKTGHHN